MVMGSPGTLETRAGILTLVLCGCVGPEPFSKVGILILVLCGSVGYEPSSMMAMVFDNGAATSRLQTYTGRVILYEGL